MRKELGAILVGAMLLIACSSNALESIGAGVGYDILRKSPLVEVNAGGISTFRGIRLTGRLSAGKIRRQEKSIDARKDAEGYGGMYWIYSGRSHFSGFNIGVEAGLEHKTSEHVLTGITLGVIWDFVDIDSHIIEQTYSIRDTPIGDPRLFSHKSYFRGVTPTIGATIKTKQGRWMDGIGLNYVFSPKASRVPDLPEDKDSLFRNGGGWRLSMSIAYIFQAQ